MRMIVGFCGVIGADWVLVSTRIGGIPVWWLNGVSSVDGSGAFWPIGGPASSGVRKAFSHDPARGSSVAMVG